MTRSEQIYAHASKDLGLSELPGSKSAPRIQRAIRLSAAWLDDDDSVTAWCGCIRGLWGIETATGVPPAHYRAKSWLEWGQGIAGPAFAIKGDTVILHRPGGYHVALFDRFSGNFVFTLGGNQSNAVNISRYRSTDIVGIRR